MFSPLIVIDSFGTVYLLGENAQEAIVGWFVLEACTDGEFSWIFLTDFSMFRISSEKSSFTEILLTKVVETENL